MAPRGNFLDPIIKIEDKKLDPVKYAAHINWGNVLENPIEQGHSKKGKFQPRDRPLMTNELVNSEKKRNIPAPGTYEASKGDKPLLGVTDRSVKSAYILDVATH